MTPAQEQAARFTGTLWKAVHFAGGVTIEQPRLFRAAFDPAWLPALPLPAGRSLPQGQPAALLDNRHHTLERHLQDETLRAAIEHRPRTRICENVGHDGTGTWYALTARHITRLSRSGQPVMVSVFESGTGTRRSAPTGKPGSAPSSR